MSHLQAEVGEPFVREVFVQQSAPPITEGGLIGWLRRNLFSDIANTLLTLFGLYLIYALVWPLIHFGIVEAFYEGSGRQDCLGQDGACWPMVAAKINFYLFGFYPAEERWRATLTLFAGLALLVPFLIPSAPFKRINAVALLGVYPVVAFILLTGGNLDLGDGFVFGLGGLVAPALGVAPGNVDVAAFSIDWVLFIAVIAAAIMALGVALGVSLADVAASAAVGLAILGGVIAFFGIDFGLRAVETAQWGGLLVTIVIAVVGIVASLPLGILLALGRRSDMPTVSLFCTGFIEFWRGIPLITVLFMSSVMFPLFLPEGVNFDKLLRALIGVTLFSSAYMAEVIRGGLQAIPKGQFEGSNALGLNYGQTMRLVVLPQAIKHVIPGIVNSFIALFKDTTLVLIIGLFDLLGAVQNSFTDSNWATPVQSHTGYLFAGLIFWVFCFSMSQYSYFLERKLNTGHRS